MPALQAMARIVKIGKSDIVGWEVTTKIYAIVDALGNPLKFTITPDQRHDITQAIELTEHIANIIVIADKGYDSNTFIESLGR